VSKLSDLLANDAPIIMGIINATPDSFSDGGKYNRVDAALNRIETMVVNGARIIDVGGESTRPNAQPVTEKEEIERVIPILQQAIQQFHEPVFSIDTTKYKVARLALEAGVQIVNDVSGLRKEPRLAELCGQYEAAYVLMHSIKTPQTMQYNPEYVDVVAEVNKFFSDNIGYLKQAGVKEIILDPGIGFGKTLDHNLKLIAQLDTFKKNGFPVLVGASRKSMIGQILDGCPPEERLIGTLAVHYHALTKGSDILRVHDVKEASESVRIFKAINKHH
jgi:dihydropteroate synthase